MQIALSGGITVTSPGTKLSGNEAKEYIYC